MMSARALPLVALLAGCPTPTTGTVQLELATAPGSTLLDGVTRLRVTLTSPKQVVEARRGANGFTLALDVEATGETGAIIVEGLDDTDALIASGQSPEFSIAAVNARIVVYMAQPLSIDRAPLALMPARANVAVGALPYGAVLAGGRDPTTLAPSDAIAIYNAYDHSIAGGMAMPEPRDGVVVATTTNGGVYLFGGRDAAMNAAGTYWLFDTTFPPTGRYFDLGDHPGFARADQVAIPIAVERFLLTGAPAIETQGTTVVDRTTLPALAPTGAAHVASDGTRTALALDATGTQLVRFRGDVVDMLPLAPPRPDAAIALLPDGRFLVIGGGTSDEQNDLVVVDPTAGTTATVADALAFPHVAARVAVTRRHVVIVDGVNAPEILDATTLARAEAPFAAPPLSGPAIALPNDQVLIADVDGSLSLFTPPPPSL